MCEEPLTQGDYELLKIHLKSWRDVLLAKTLRNTGLRINEALRLEARQVQQSGPASYISIRRSKQQRKGQSEWEPVFLNPQLGLELRSYVQGMALKPTDRVFPISDRQVRNVFYQAGLRAIGRRVHPHEFRHLYIKTLVDGGLPMEITAKMVGHDDSGTTRRWYYELTHDQRRGIQERVPV